MQLTEVKKNSECNKPESLCMHQHTIIAVHVMLAVAKSHTVLVLKNTTSPLYT